jgi:hypothetical protein
MTDLGRRIIVAKMQEILAEVTFAMKHNMGCARFCRPYILIPLGPKRTNMLEFIGTQSEGLLKWAECVVLAGARLWKLCREQDALKHRQHAKHRS